MYPIDEFQDSLRRIVGVLNRLSVRYHLTGGAATIAYSEPRLTQDIDLVLDRQQLGQRVEEFIAAVDSEGFTFDKSTVQFAITNGKCFQLLDAKCILKIDLYPRELIAGELDRSVQMQMFKGVSLPVVALQDLILSKLIWISHGSGKSRGDLRRLWQISSPEDQNAIRAYAGKHRLTDLLNEVLQESDEIDV